MAINIWAVVGTVTGFIPVTALIGTAGQLFGMNEAGAVATWKNWLVLNDQLQGPAGTVGAPSIAFVGDLSSGWYRPAADQWALSIAGVQALLVQSTKFTFKKDIVLDQKLLQTDKGADIAAAATTDLAAATGNTLDITNAAGNINLVSLGGATIPAGTTVETKFVITGGSVTLIHDAASLILLSGANILLQTGDFIRWRKINDAAANWEMIGFQRGTASGQITTKGGWLVGSISGANIVPVEKIAPANSNIRFADSTAADGWTDDTFRKKNKIYNGAWRFDQINEGTLYTAGALIQTVDGWTASLIGVGVFKVRRLTDPDFPSQFCLEVTCTTIDAAITAGDYYILKHAIEGYDVSDLRAGTATAKRITISFDMKFSVAGVYGIAIQNSAANRSYVGTVTQNVANTRESKTVTLTLDTAGTWLYTQGIGLQLSFCLAGGSGFQAAAAGVWGAGAFYTIATQANFMSNVANIGYIGQIQLEKGAVATEFEDLSFAEDLARVQRYYTKTFDIGQAAVQASGTFAGSIISDYAYSSGVGCIGTFQFPVVMRATPTVITYNPTQANTNWRNQGNSADTNQTDTGSSTRSITRQADVSTVGGNSYRLHVTANARLS